MILDETEVDPLNRLALQDFSYSRLNCFSECEARYFYSYVLREPMDFGNPALLGNIIHKALEITLEDGQQINLHELLQNYRDAVGELDPEANIPEGMLTDGEGMLIQYVDDHPGDMEFYAKELPFSFVLGPARFNGFIDLVSVYPTRVVIRDYKSGKQEITYKSTPDNLQLGIYSLIAKKMFPDKEVYAEVYYLRSGKAKGHLFTDDDLSKVEAKLLDQVTEVLNKTDFKTTANERACLWCSYAKNGVCPTGESRLRRRNLLPD